MYKILIADDEKIEREGISTLIDWEKNGFFFCGAARNGVEAYEIISDDPPDIVITDIKMPVMNGLELIERVKNNFPSIVFVVLSGYGEYDYTSKAMRHGVRHYLLKPCEENQVIEVLSEVVKELDLKDEEKKIVSNLKDNLEMLLPHAKEQFLRDAAITGVYSEHNITYYKSIFGIADDSFILINFKIDKKCQFIDKFALKNIAEEIIQWERVTLSTILDDTVLILSKIKEDSEMDNLLTNIQRTYLKYYGISIWIAVSERGSFEDIHNMYQQTKAELKYRFNLSEGSIITKLIMEQEKANGKIDLSVDFESISDAIRTGNLKELNLCFKVFFAKLEIKKHVIREIREYCLKLIRIILRHGNLNIQGQYESISGQVMEYKNIKQFSNLINKLSNEIINLNNHMVSNEQDLLVEKMIRHIHENINNPKLGLLWIAKDVLYMNEEYLGRVFNKKMNEKFSNYVLRIRMEMAKRLIESTRDLKVHEVSRLVGFTEDAQYFSKLFKQYIGSTPSEYKKQIQKKKE